MHSPLAEEEAHKQWVALRRIMYEPSKVWLATEYSGDRWITDQYVLYDATGLEALYCYDSSYGIQWPDGPYRLTVSKGLKERDSVPEPDIEAYFQGLDGRKWSPASPTDWSVAEHPGKAMLWAFGVGSCWPCLLGESTWTEIKRYYPRVRVEYAKEGNLFRFSIEARPPFCYAAGIQCPDGQEDVASKIVSAAHAA